MMKTKVFRVRILLLLDSSIIFVHGSIAPNSMTIGEADSLFSE